MGMNFTPQEGSALYGLLADNATNVILKTDRDGFVLHASPAAERLGFPLPRMLIGPHILDLVHPSWVADIKAEHEAAIAGRQEARWIEFPAVTEAGGEKWFEIQIRSLMDDHDRICGALSIMRSIQERRALEEKLFAAAMTDPLTGLTNRRAFIQMLNHLVERDVGGCLAVVDIDHFQSINMQYGQSVGDEVLVVFSDLVRTLMRSDDIISRIGGESLGILLPATPIDRAGAICRRIIETLSDVRRTAGGNSFSITASAGVARIGGSLDSTIKRAELALFLAKARGRNRMELDDSPGEA